MDFVNTLIALALLAWGLQIGLGFLQVRAFNRMLQMMSLKGVVKIGRTASRWRPRTLVVLAHDNNGVIVDAKMLKGMTVFSRPKTIKSLICIQTPLSDKLLAELAPAVREAVVCALSTK
ncbi:MULTISPECIES: transcriptional regulator GutM [Aeromonas]|uniref:Transcriptional regulator GutM n=1 Tax=Aeromonas caviae TaxID=648 RepID=A0A7T4C266_AERCA|nr:transcriptional regulator GutM [Aeromonas caviae]QQA60045.1 transcriptional regulator GutM [Aeromonas caviae]